MRKLGSMGAILFLLLGIVSLARPAAALPPCECEFCSVSPNSWCWADEFGGFRFRCYEYTSLYCFASSASPESTEKTATPKVAQPARFTLDELVAVPWTDFDPNRPILKPGC